MVRLIVIAKECVPGRVKTRLTPPLSPEQAASLASVSLHQTLEIVRSVEVEERVLLFDGDPKDVDTEGFRIETQSAGRLDERIADAFDARPSPVLLIGMDTPQLSRQVLQAVVDDDGSEAWFGPAKDGGFWALGLRTPDGDLVRGVPMSQWDTGAVQLRRLHRAGLRTRVLPQLTDVDRYVDAVVVASNSSRSKFSAAVDALDLESGRNASSIAIHF